ncbi:hypothetical protein [Methanosarcina horonobensis]|nr:hypothetical protein [Methanosarcina horonobensis]
MAPVERQTEATEEKPPEAEASEENAAPAPSLAVTVLVVGAAYLMKRRK